MELYFLDKDFSLIDYIDVFSSVVWSEKFYDVGTFTLHFPREYLRRIMDAVYVRSSFADGDIKCGRIEYISADTDGDCEMSGHTLEVLLYDRIITGSGIFSGTVTEAVTAAVSANLRDCGVVLSDDQPLIPDNVALSYDHDNLASWLYSTLKPYGASFRVTLEPDTELPTFSIVLGTDRTTGTGSAQPAVFSSSFGNIVSLEYIRDITGEKNVAYVKGYGGFVVTVDQSTPYSRREIHVNADDIKPSDFDTPSDFEAALRARGIEALSERCDGMQVSAECDADAVPVYGVDYFLGDQCDVCDNDIGLSFSLRLTEVDTVYENGSKTVFPSFGDEVRSIKKLLGDR